MFNKIISSILIISFVTTGIVYPADSNFLAKTSSFQDSIFSGLISILSFIKGNPGADAEKLKARFNVSITRNAAGVWISKDCWKVRFFEPAKDKDTDIGTDDELVYEEDVNDSLRVQVFFGGLSEDDKRDIKAFLMNNPGVSALGRMVIRELGGREPVVPSGRIVRRDAEKDGAEVLSRFIEGIVSAAVSYEAVVDAVIREIDAEAENKFKDALKDYIEIFMRRAVLKEKRDEILQGQELFVFKKLSELKDGKEYKMIMRLMGRLIGKDKRLKIVSRNAIGRIVARYEGLKEKDIDPAGILSFTWGGTIYFNDDARLSDFVVYMLHEVVHLYGGGEDDARRADKEIIAVIKGVTNLLRNIKVQDKETRELLNFIAAVMDYEVLGYELDIHTARLQAFPAGEVFLRRFGLAGISVFPDDPGYIKDMRKPVSRIIKQKKNAELFDDIKRIVRDGRKKKTAFRIFWAFIRYIRRVVEERKDEDEEDEETEQVELVEPVYSESVLSYVITEEEAMRRLNEVVLNPDAPLFARINEAIMLDMFSRTKRLELQAIEKIKPLLNDEPVKALQILEELRNRKSVELISEFLAHSDYKARKMAARCLFNIARKLIPQDIFSSPETINNLLKYISKPKIKVADIEFGEFLKIITVLSSIRCREAVPVLMDIIEQNKDPKIRMFVADELGSIGDTSIIPLVKERLLQSGGIAGEVLCAVILSEIPNDESAEMIIKAFIKAKDDNLKMLYLKKLENVVRRRRISTDVMFKAVETLMTITGDDENTGLANFILGRVISVAAQEGRLELFNTIKQDVLSEWEKNVTENPPDFESLSFGIMHDTFMDIEDLKGMDIGHPLKEVMDLFFEGAIGSWDGIIGYMQKLRDDLYAGRRVYKDIVWKEIAEKLDELKPEDKFVLGRQWFQRMCLAVSYRVLLDTWDIGRIEDRDFILELMILRSTFVTKDQLPDGAIGATEAVHGDYVVLDDSLFSSPLDIPGGVNTVWHEAAHLLRAMGIADIGDIDLLGASSHNNIELYLISEIMGLPSIGEAVERFRKGDSVEDILSDYEVKDMPENSAGTIRSILLGMSVRDRAEGPLEAFFMTRNINPKKMRERNWEEVLWKLGKINTEVIEAYTTRGKAQILVHTYFDGARFSGYAQRLGVETGFSDAANIYVELLIKERMRPGQAEFVSRTVARFMTTEDELLEKMKKETAGRCKDVPEGEIEKWIRKYVIEKIKLSVFKMCGDAGLWITYSDLDRLVEKAYQAVKAEMQKEDAKSEICGKVIKSVSGGRKIFKVVRPSHSYARYGRTKLLLHIKDREGTLMPVAVYELANKRYAEIDVDFGRGEEVYAYVDKERNEIYLLNPDDDRIDKIEEILGCRLNTVESMQIDSPAEEVLQTSGEFDLDILTALKKYWIYAVAFSIPAILMITGLWEIALAIAIMASIAFIIYKYPGEMKRKLAAGRFVNREFRNFIKKLEERKLVMQSGESFGIEDLNRYLCDYDRNELVRRFEREFRMDKRAADRIIDCVYKILEYKEEVTVNELESMVMPLFVEEIMVNILTGRYIYPVKGRIYLGKIKGIGFAGCFNYARRGWRKLHRVIKEAYKLSRIRKDRLDEFTRDIVSAELADYIYDVYRSLRNRNDMDEFTRELLRLDISPYVSVPTKRHKLIREYKRAKSSFVKAEENRTIFDTVLDTHGILKGLELLKKIKERNAGKESRLFWILSSYLGFFEIGPEGYIPVQIEDAWLSFDMWKKRKKEVTYEDVLAKFLELYMRYIYAGPGEDEMSGAGKDGMSKWGWTLLWLGYYEKGSKMYNAVAELLKITSVHEETDVIRLLDDLCVKHGLSDKERRQLLYAMPIDGFIMLVKIYCKDVIWGKTGFPELEERLKREMNVVIESDILNEGIFNKDVNSWLYTLGNMPEDVEETARNKLKTELIELMLERLAESGLITDKEDFRGRLNRILHLLYRVRFPENGARFIEAVCVIDICKVLFDYARNIIANDTAVKKLHLKKNREVFAGRRSMPGDLNDRDGLLLKALTGGRDIRFSDYGRDCLNEFYGEINGQKRLLIFTHRHTETIGLLFWIQRLLKENPSLLVRIVPQKSLWELNSTREDILAVLDEENKSSAGGKGLRDLGDFLKKGRFVILDDCAPGLSWIKGAEKAAVINEIETADVLLGAGWDNFVSLQGLNRPCYFAFSIDDIVKEKLTGCGMNEPVFIKTAGGITAARTGAYRYYDYLHAVNSNVYKLLLEYFKGNRARLHEWIKLEAERTGMSETEIMTSEDYIGSAGLFSDCAFRAEDGRMRQAALYVLMDNVDRFGIRIERDAARIKLGDFEIHTGVPSDCYYIPGKDAVILFRDGEVLVLEVVSDIFPDEDGNISSYLRIGDMVYKADRTVNLLGILKEPFLWLGNGELVEFFGIDKIKNIIAGEKGSPGVSLQDIPQDVIRQIPKGKSEDNYEVAEYDLRQIREKDAPHIFRLHYAMILVSSPDIAVKVKGYEEIERLMSGGDRDILDIVRERGLSREKEAALKQVPAADADLFILTNFTSRQERLLRVLRGGHLLRPPLVKMPGQGVSARFYNLLRTELAKTGIDVVQGNYARGTGTVLMQDGSRQYIWTHDLLLQLSGDLQDGHIVGAVRLERDGKRIVQFPANSGILNYLKVVHHLAHIMSERFKEIRGETADPLQEFTPIIEDILIVKSAERLYRNLQDGFNEFKQEIEAADSENELKDVFAKYGPAYSSGKDFAVIKQEVLGIRDMTEFAEYIENNNMGGFTSLKELLGILIEYIRSSVNQYIERLPVQEKAVLYELLKADSDKEINNILSIASMLCGCQIPKIDFNSYADIMRGLTERTVSPPDVKRDEILGRIDQILEGREPFSAKAGKIVGSLIYRMGLTVSEEERREIESRVMDILSGKWLQNIEDLLNGRILALERQGVDTGRLKDAAGTVGKYMIGASEKIQAPKPLEEKPVDIDTIRSWNEIKDYVQRSGIKRVFCDIDKTIIDAPGFITTTPWFREMTDKVGLEETIRMWRELETEVMKRGMIHLMEESIPHIIKELQTAGVEVILYTARDKDDLPRTVEILKSVGIEGLEIITSTSGGPEQKRDALAEYYKAKGLFKGKKVPSLYIDDTLANLKTVCADNRFRHIKGLWYRAPHEKRYEVDPMEFLTAGDQALESGNAMEALEWYYNAFYVISRKDIANMVCDTVCSYMGFESCIEKVFYKIIKSRLDRYRSAREREEGFVMHQPVRVPDEKKITWLGPAPDTAGYESLEGVKRIIVIGSHPHGDHIKGFLDYAKRRLRNLVDTKVPAPDSMKTGGTITHSLSNYWGRIGKETIVLFDLGWFPENFVDPLIQTVNPRDLEIVFIMDSFTNKTLGFGRQIKRLKSGGVKVRILGYDKKLNIPIEESRIMQIENYPAYHLDPKVGSSIYIVKIIDKDTGKEVQSIGYISEIGDVFPGKMDKELLEKICRLDRIIVDGTNLIAKKGEEPLPLAGRENKIHKYVDALNRGKYLLAHFNTTGIRMGEEAEIVNERLNPDIPIIIIAGKDAIEQLKRSYQDKETIGTNYYKIADRKVYLVDDIAAFHNEWRKDGKKADRYQGPEGRVKELEELFETLKKTKAVIISSSQFRGDPTQKRYQNFKGFQILDAIVDREDVCILIEGRLHMDDKEGFVLRKLLAEKGERTVRLITGERKVRASIDSQWRSGHITFESLMNLLSRIASESVKLGNVHRTRTFIPAPSDEWLGMVPEGDAEKILRKYKYKDLKDVIEIINRWNNYKEVSDAEMQFVRKILKSIFGNENFWSRYFRGSDVSVLRENLLGRLKKTEEDMRLRGRARNRIFVASSSKFVDVLRREIRMDPKKISELFGIADDFEGFEVGVSHDMGKTIDLVSRRYGVYSRDLLEECNRQFLKELYSMTAEGKLPPDLSGYLERKNPDEFKDKFTSELQDILEDAKKEARKKEKEIFGIWFGDVKRYIESQFLRIGLRHADRVVMPGELRKELAVLYDAVIQSVFNFLQEDTKEKFADIGISACGDYALGKPLFKDMIYLAVFGKAKAGVRNYAELSGRMKVILNKLGIPAEFADMNNVLHKRIVVPCGGDFAKEIGRDILEKRKGRFAEDESILESRKSFDIHTGPGGLDDIELIRHFFSASISSEEEKMLNDAEEFLRRYKEEVGYTTGGDREKARELIGEIIKNLNFKSRDEFFREFYRNASCVFTVLRQCSGRQISAKNISYGEIDEEEDLHKGVFEKADREGRMFTEETAKAIQDAFLKDEVQRGFELIRKVVKENPALEGRRYKIVVEEAGKPTLFFDEGRFASVLSHGGRSTNTIYVGLNMLIEAEKLWYKNTLRNILLHEARDIERGYHLDIEDEAKEGFITYAEADEIYRWWHDIITRGNFGIMHNFYMERAGKKKYRELFLTRVPADIRLIKGDDLFKFRHGDAQFLPDRIGLNIKLFKGGYSPESQVFLLRHCTDMIRYDRYKTMINDAKYLLLVTKEERDQIFRELCDIDFVKYLQNILAEYKTGEALKDYAKGRIMDYCGIEFKRYVSPDGADICYTVGGNPDAERTLVFVHGILVNSRDWRHQITFFEDNYRIITIDLRGHGKSKGLGAKKPNIKNYAEDIEGILEKEDVRDAVLIGHSMGGMAILNMPEIYADKPIERRRVKGIVLLSAIAGDPLKSFISLTLSRFNLKKALAGALFSIGHSRGVWNNSFSRWLVKRGAVRTFFMKVAEDIVIMRETHPLFTRKVISSVFKNDTDSIIYAFNAIMTHNVEDRLDRLGVPVLWIIGDGDKIVLPVEQEEDAKRIKDCRVVRIHNAVHYPHATTPRAVNRAINRFLNGGTHRFVNLVEKRVKETFLADVSLNELETGLKSIKVRFLQRLNGLQEEELEMIDRISCIVYECSLETGVSDETMIKAVILIASQVIPKTKDMPGGKPISNEDIEKLYDYILNSA